MKALILTINDNILSGLERNFASQFLSASLFSKGVELIGVNTISSAENSVLNVLNNVPKEVETVIILGEYDPNKNLQVKKLLAKHLNDALVENNFAVSTINSYFKNSNMPASKDSLNEAKMPRQAKLIENKFSVNQGFNTYANGKHYIYLPNNVYALKNLWDDWFVNFLKAKFPKLSLTITLKTFGIKKPEAIKLLGDLLKNKNQIKILIYPNDLELSIVIKYSALTPKADIDSYTANVIERLKHYIYAEGDISIYEIAYTMLKFNKVKLAVAESITGGNIASSLIKSNTGISEYLTESVVVYTNESKINRLKIDSEIITKYGAVSADTAYEMGAGLLDTNLNCNFVLATTGYTDGANKGLVYIAVGDENALHVYKNNFAGSRQKIIEMATKAGLFYLIKKLKQNSIIIEQMFDK